MCWFLNKEQNKLNVCFDDFKTNSSSFRKSETEFNDFESRLKSAKNYIYLSAGLNLETLNTIFIGTNHI